ncbi:MAG TPA: hypothetical protein VGL46_04935 [Pseudonocardiaceae bacterium]|jgi:hypothetical protein
MGNPKKPGDPNVTSSAGVVPKKPGAQDQQGTNRSPVVKPTDRQGPLDSAGPMAQLQAKYPGQPGQPSQSGAVFQAPKQDPNAQWTWLPPNEKDYTFGAIGSGLAGIGKLNQAAGDPAKVAGMQQNLAGFQSEATGMRGLADSASDPALSGTLLSRARAAERGASYQKMGLKTLTGPEKVTNRISDPQWVGKQLSELGRKGTNAGVNAGQTVSDVGGKIEDLSPKAAGLGRKVASMGINTGLTAGKLGDGIERLGPNTGKLGQKVTAAGVNAGAKAVDLGGNLGPNVEKLGQKIAAVGVLAGGKAAAAGQELGQATKALAPRLAQAGELAGDAGKTLLKGIPIASYLATGTQATMDLAGGKAVGRVAAETAGSLIGGYAGTAIGGAIGSAVIPIPVVGTAVGAAVGNFVGSYAGGKLGDWLTDRADDVAGIEH